ncbi:toprim domain-containing protein [Sphingomicrobium sp. XHP0239]|uniref:toprim domain-containing protein n=1 Tax=Sphingomicrobium maritimum TaxID=3133972 RepID=UPI0031CC7EC6
MVSSSIATTDAGSPAAPAKLHEKHGEWLEARGISVDLAEKLGLFTAKREGKAWIAVPYVRHAETVNHKYRLTSKKDHRMDAGGVLCLWNHDTLKTDQSAPLVVCEGEWDALTAIQAGFRAVSVPNGASGAEHDKLDYLWNSRELLLEQKQFIIATDDDEKGRALRDNLIAHLGAERCKFVEYPPGCKDLNEALNIDGRDAVAECLAKAKDCPVAGVHRLYDFPKQDNVTGLPTGIDVLDDKGAIEIVPTTFTVLSGYANMGKSTVLYTVMSSLLARGVRCAIFAPEGRTWPMANTLAQAMLGCSRYELERHPNLYPTLDAIHDRLSILTNHNDEDLEFDVDTMLEKLEYTVLQHSVKFIAIDPWNELDHKRRRDESLTEYVSRAIKRLRAFAKAHNVAVWVVAHPTKPAKGNSGMPSLYDVSDSAHWANKADYGLIYHRDDKSRNDAQLAMVKKKEWLPGEYVNERVKLDHRTGRICRYEN